MPAPCSAGIRRPTCRRAAPPRAPARARRSAGWRTRSSPIRRSAGCSTASPPMSESQPYDSDDASLIRVVRRDYEKATKVPADFVARWSEMGSASYDAWTRARPANDFATMRPYLEKALDFSRKYAGLPRALRAHRRPADRRPRRGHDGRQRARAVHRAARRAGADRARHRRAAGGRRFLPARRLPRADAARLRPHVPSRASATTSTAAGSTRRIIRSAPSSRPATCASPRACARTRSARRCSRRCTKPATPCTSRASTPRYEGTPLDSGTSAGVHESQSRLWENVVGRSRGVLGALLSRAARRLPGAVQDACRSKPSIAPSTRSSAR